METRANYVLVGVSVLAALAAIVVFAFWLGRSEFNKQEDTFYTYFTGSVTGLSPGGPVRYRGVQLNLAYAYGDTTPLTEVPVCRSRSLHR